MHGWAGHWVGHTLGSHTPIHQTPGPMAVRYQVPAQVLTISWGFPSLTEQGRPDDQQAGETKA